MEEEDVIIPVVQQSNEPDFYDGLQSLVDNNASNEDFLAYSQKWDSDHGTSYTSEYFGGGNGTEQSPAPEQTEPEFPEGHDDFYNQLEEMVANNASSSEIEVFVDAYDSNNGTNFWNAMTGRSGDRVLSNEAHNARADVARQTAEAAIFRADLPDWLSEPLFAFGQTLFQTGANVADFAVQQVSMFDEDLQEKLDKATPEERNRIWDEYNNAGDWMRENAEYLGLTQSRYGSGDILQELQEGNYYNAAKETIKGVSSGLASLVPFLAGGPAGLAILGTSAAGGAFEEDIEQKEGPVGAIRAASYLKGGVEVASEYFTRGILKRAGQLARSSKFTNVGEARKAVQEYVKSNWEVVGKDMFTEGVSEGLADTGARIVDNIIYGDEINPRDAIHGFFNNAIIGTIIGGGVTQFSQLAKPGAGKYFAGNILKKKDLREQDQEDLNQAIKLQEQIDKIEAKGGNLSYADQASLKSLKEEKAAIKKEFDARDAEHIRVLDNMTKDELLAYAESVDASYKIEEEKKENKRNQAAQQEANNLEGNEDANIALNDETIAEESIYNDLSDKELGKQNEIYNKVQQWPEVAEQANRATDLNDEAIAEKQEQIDIINTEEEFAAQHENPNPVGTKRRKAKKKKNEKEIEAFNKNKKGIAQTLEAIRPGVKWRKDTGSFETLTGRSLDEFIIPGAENAAASEPNIENIFDLAKEKYDKIPKETRDAIFGGLLSTPDFTIEEFQDYIDTKGRVVNDGQTLGLDDNTLSDIAELVDGAEVLDNVELPFGKKEPVAAFLSDDAKVRKLPKLREQVQELNINNTPSDGNAQIDPTLLDNLTYDELAQIKRQMGSRGNDRQGNPRPRRTFEEAMNLVVGPQVQTAQQQGKPATNELAQMMSMDYKEVFKKQGYGKYALSQPAQKLADTVASVFGKQFYTPKHKDNAGNQPSIIPVQSAVVDIGLPVAKMAGYVDKDGQLTEKGEALFDKESKGGKGIRYVNNRPYYERQGNIIIDGNEYSKISDALDASPGLTYDELQDRIKSKDFPQYTQGETQIGNEPIPAADKKATVIAKLGAGVLDVMANNGKIKVVTRVKNIGNTGPKGITKTTSNLIEITDPDFAVALANESDFGKERHWSKRPLYEKSIDNLRDKGKTPKELEKNLGFSLFTRLDEQVENAPIPENTLDHLEEELQEEYVVSDAMSNSIMQHKDHEIFTYADKIDKLEKERKALLAKDRLSVTQQETLSDINKDLLSFKSKARVNEEVFNDAQEGVGKEFMTFAPLKYWGGRMGNKSPYLSPKGNDLSKALLQFRHGKKLGQNGFRDLKVNLADAHGAPGVQTIDARAKYVDQNLDTWLDGYRAHGLDYFHKKQINGKENPGSQVSEPMVFLANLMEVERIRAIERSGGNVADIESGIGVQSDSSSQQIQIVAGITGDATLARVSNLIKTPGKDQVDAYSYVSKDAFDDIVLNKDTDMNNLKKVSADLIKLEKAVDNATTVAAQDKAIANLKNYINQNAFDINRGYYALFNMPKLLANFRSHVKGPVLETGYGAGSKTIGKQFFGKYYDRTSEDGYQYLSKTMASMFADQVVESYDTALPTMKRYKRAMAQIAEMKAMPWRFNEKGERLKKGEKRQDRVEPENLDYTLPITDWRVMAPYKEPVTRRVPVSIGDNTSTLSFITGERGVNGDKAVSSAPANTVLSLDSELPAFISLNPQRSYPFSHVYDGFITPAGAVSNLREDLVRGYQEIFNPDVFKNILTQMTGSEALANKFYDSITQDVSEPFNIKKDLSAKDYPYAMIAAGSNVMEQQTKPTTSDSVSQSTLAAPIKNFMAGKPQTGQVESARDVTPLLDKLKKSFPNVKMIVGKDAMIKRLEEAGQTNVVKKVQDNEVKGFVDHTTNDVYLNEETLNYEAPIHEYGHIWTEITKSERPALYKKGVSLIKKSAVYKDLVEQSKDSSSVYYGREEAQLVDEAIATAIGKHGQNVFDGVTDQNKWNKYVDSLFKWLGNKLNLSKPFNKLKLNEFLEIAVAEVLTGAPIKSESDIQVARNSLASPVIAFSETGLQKDNTQEMNKKTPRQLHYGLDKEIEKVIKDGLKVKSSASPYKFTPTNHETKIKLNATKAHWPSLKKTISLEKKQELLDKIKSVVESGRADRKQRNELAEKKKQERREGVAEAIKLTSGINVGLTKTEANRKAKERTRFLDRLRRGGIANLFSTTSNQDFHLLIYEMYPKGKTREAVKKMFEEELIRPVEQANLNFLKQKDVLTANWVGALVSGFTNADPKTLSGKQIKQHLNKARNLLNEKSPIVVAGDPITNDEVVKAYNTMKDSKTAQNQLKKGLGENPEQQIDKIIDYVNSKPELKRIADAIPGVYKGVALALNAKLDEHGRETFDRVRIDPDSLTEKDKERYMKIYGYIPSYTQYTPVEAQGEDTDVDVDKLIEEHGGDWMYTVMAGRLKNRTGGGEITFHTGRSMTDTFNNYLDGPVRTLAYLDFARSASDFFGPKQLDAMRAAYGDVWVNSMKDSLRRIVTGKNLSTIKNKTAQEMDKWFRDGISVIMSVNPKSAALQHLSFLNFLVDDNKAWRMGLAANSTVKKEVKEFMKNTPWFKYRGAGNIDVAVEAAFEGNGRLMQSEIYGKIKAKVLEKGFFLTKWGDRNAIALGGAPYMTGKYMIYRNQGLSKEDALQRAYEDFAKQADRTQQSTRPDRLGGDQTTHFGKYVLAFGNTQQQYNRVISAAIKDLSARGSSTARKKQAMGEIFYYGLVQNYAFNGLSTLAIIAHLSGDFDEEDDTANRMFDTLLKGVGLKGGIAIAGKNAAFEILEGQDSQRGVKVDKVLLEFLSVSPAIQTKIRHVLTAANAKKIYSRSELIDDPIYYQLASGITAATNFPTDRALKLVEQLYDAAAGDYNAVESVLRVLGWSPFDLGEGDLSPLNRLDGAETGQMHNDGTLEVDKDLSEGERRKTISHEAMHAYDMEHNGLDYDDSFLYWKGEKFARENGKINYNGAWMEEGDPNFPWERRAYEAETKPPVNGDYKIVET